MGEAVLPGDLASLIKDLERRLKVLESAPRVGNLSTINGVQASTIAASQSTSSGSYTDLATVGPIVTIQVPNTGRLLLIASAEIVFTGTGSVGGDGGKVGYQIVGTVNAVGPVDMLRLQATNLPSINTIDITTSYIYLVVGLAVETVTVALKYLSANPSGVATFANRSLIVIPL